MTGNGLLIGYQLACLLALIGLDDSLKTERIEQPGPPPYGYAHALKLVLIN